MLVGDDKKYLTMLVTLRVKVNRYHPFPLSFTPSPKYQYTYHNYWKDFLSL